MLCRRICWRCWSAICRSVVAIWFRELRLRQQLGVEHRAFESSVVRTGPGADVPQHETDQPKHEQPEQSCKEQDEQSLGPRAFDSLRVVHQAAPGSFDGRLKCQRPSGGR